MTPWGWVDGAFDRVGSGAPAEAGGALFETVGEFGGGLPLWDRHMRRLQHGMRRVGDAAPLPDGLLAAALELLRRNTGSDVVRLERRLRPRGGSFCITTRARSAGAWARARGGPEPRSAVRLVPTVARRPAGAPPADLKAMPRAFQDTVLAEARASSADDGIVLGDDGALLETAIGNLWLSLDGRWVTPALDGRVLPGIARALLLERMAALGVAAAERRCDLADLHRARALCVSNAAYGPCPAVLVGEGRAGAPPVEDLDTALIRAWQTVVPD